MIERKFGIFIYFKQKLMLLITPFDLRNMKFEGKTIFIGNFYHVLTCLVFFLIQWFFNKLIDLKT